MHGTRLLEEFEKRQGMEALEFGEEHGRRRIEVGWPGSGTLLVLAARQNDRPLMLGIVLLVALTVVVFNILTDLLYGKIDPRVRLS